MVILTSEETRVPIYFGDQNPTVAREVDSKTPLESLNLNWTEQELPEKERTKHVHRLHPYLGKYIPQLVEIFLRKYFKAGQVILDPFIGSGTTLVQANELGINSLGFDISAFNILLCRAKTAKYDLQRVHIEVMDILEKTRKITQHRDIEQSENDHVQLNCLEAASHQRQQYEDARQLTDNQYLQQWFAPQALYELLTYRDLIETEGYEYSNLLKIILSRSARSARLTTHFDLDFPKNPRTEPYWCYKHSRFCQPTTESFKFIKRYSTDTVKRIKSFSQKHTDAITEVFHADSRQASIPMIDGVITSPPYVGLIDYHEQHAYAYNLLNLEDKRGLEIGAAACGTSQKAKQQYQEDIAEVFQRISHSMKPGGRMIVVAGDRANLYGGIADLVGVEVESIVQRHVNRRTGRRSGEFYESVFIWRKP